MAFHPCSASLLSHTYVHICTFTHIRKHIDSARLPSGNTPHLAGTCLMLTQRNIRPSLQFSPHPNDTAPKSPTVTHTLLHVQYSITDIEASVLLSVLVPHEHLYLSVVRSVGLYMQYFGCLCSHAGSGFFFFLLISQSPANSISWEILRRGYSVYFLTPSIP